MPRIRCNIQPDDPGDNDPVDVCRGCWPDLDPAALADIVGYSVMHAASDMDESHPGGDDHPTYGEQSPPYRCRVCNVDLTEEDD